MKIIPAFIFLAHAALCHAANYTEIVAFGDSLTDMGNRSVSLKKEEPVKFRQTWVAQLAGPKMLNIVDFKPSGMSSFFGGTNYAVGGATTEFAAKMGGDRNRGQNLTQQISRRYLNPAFNPGGARPEALHIVRIGTNDLMLACITPAQMLTQWSRLDEVGAGIAKSTEGQIQALAAAGVKHVLWGNLSDTAQIPAIVSRVKSLGGALAPTVLTALTKATVAHNQEMDAAIARLEKAYPPLHIIKLDLYTKFAEIARDPAKYGFADVSIGANDNKHLFSADGLHPTIYGHKMLAEYAFEVLSNQVVSQVK